jgi:hypothetical protein
MDTESRTEFDKNRTKESASMQNTFLLPEWSALNVFTGGEREPAWDFLITGMHFVVLLLQKCWYVHVYVWGGKRF